MLKVILVPLDGSPLAETALEPAMVLARRCNAELLLVHALYPDEASEWTAREHIEPEAYLESLAQNLRSEGVSVRTSLLPMEAAHGIVDEADLSNVDVIVMTPRERRGLASMLHPSVTWQVFQQSNAPVLACQITSADDPAASMKRLPRFMTEPLAPILVPLDGSLQSESALPLAEELAQTFGNPILLVSAQEQPLPSYPSGAAWGPMGPMGTGEDTLLVTRATRQAEQEARRYLEGKRAEIVKAGLRVQIEVGPGPAALLIEDTVKERKAGLIVMASHGRGWLGRLVLGSVAQKVLREVDVPVLLVRREPISRDGEQPPDQREATEQPTT
jgi:nucleotide-binding universal stress UspA family protein